MFSFLLQYSFSFSFLTFGVHYVKFLLFFQPPKLVFHPFVIPYTFYLSNPLVFLFFVFFSNCFSSIFTHKLFFFFYYFILFLQNAETQHLLLFILLHTHLFQLLHLHIIFLSLYLHFFFNLHIFFCFCFYFLFSLYFILVHIFICSYFSISSSFILLNSDFLHSFRAIILLIIISTIFDLFSHSILFYLSLNKLFISNIIFFNFFKFQKTLLALLIKIIVN